MKLKKTFENRARLAKRMVCAGLLMGSVMAISPAVGQAATAKVKPQGVVRAENCLYYTVDRVVENQDTNRSMVYGRVVNTCANARRIISVQYSHFDAQGSSYYFMSVGQKNYKKAKFLAAGYEYDLNFNVRGVTSTGTYYFIANIFWR